MDRHCYTCPIAEEGVICGAKYSSICKRHVTEYQAQRAEIMKSIRLRTEHVFPPIPVREWDWSAVDDKTYDEGAPIGWGRTKQAAVDNLIDILTE